MSLTFSWTTVGLPSVQLNNVAMSQSGQYMFACTPIATSSTSGGALYMSSDYGETWDTSLTFALKRTCDSVAVSATGDFIFVTQTATGSVSGNLDSYISTDFGTTWALSSSAQYVFEFSEVAMSSDASYIYGCTSGLNDGIFINTLGGLGAWTNVHTSA
jgi:hypothetical protein